MSTVMLPMVKIGDHVRIRLWSSSWRSYSHYHGLVLHVEPRWGEIIGLIVTEAGKFSNARCYFEGTEKLEQGAHTWHLPDPQRPEGL